MTLLGQKMPNVSSAAMAIAVPAGAAYDPDDASGAAYVTTEWAFRGAGERDTRALNDALDALGCQRHESVRSRHVLFSSVQLGRNLHDVLRIYADIVRRPGLDDTTFEPARALVLQDLMSLEDEPARKCNLLLYEKFYPFPLGRCIYGTVESLKSMTPTTIREHAAASFSPDGTILAVAGNFEWEQFRDVAAELFGDWSSGSPHPANTRPAQNGVTHVEKESAQTHIALAHPSVPPCDDHYYSARMAEAVLSCGMSGRLFTEVREKRGLAYHVSCCYHSLKDHAGFFTYAGTRPDLAQKTFDVTVLELRRLEEGIEDHELDRARTQLKSALVMQGESTAARSESMISDWYHLRRLRGLKEISEAIDGVSRTDVLEYLRDYPAKDFVVLTLGPQALDTSIISE